MKSKRKSTFDPQVYLESVGASRKVAEFRKKQALYSQGAAADTVMYIQKGSVKLTVVNETGKEAVVAIFGFGDFFGEGGLAGQTVRMATATAIVPTTVLVIGKDQMIRALHAGPSLSDRFITYMLARNIPRGGGPDRSVVQLHGEEIGPNSSAARSLRQGRPGRASTSEGFSGDAGEMIGTTCPHVNLFMNKFRNLGFIEYGYNGGIKVNNSLLTVVLHQ